ncbi:MAG: ribose 1,5-bisphosphate isomerase [Candidatus Thermoplasmatota archaeon]|nr:ribose 1,5-bisphosphate isomerase [Candidatus Thermoplasmatota archaeon]
MQGNEHWKAVEDASERIRSMKVRGAGSIARSAAQALSDFSKSYNGEDLVMDLRKAARMLLDTRPTAVSLRNGISMTLSGCDRGVGADEVRRIVMDNADDFVKGSLGAVSEIGRIGSELIPNGSTVLTHCNSSAALSMIGHAFDDGRVKEVICTESRPWRQGHITARWLAGRGIPVTMIVDSASGLMMDEVDLVVVGADTITSEGRLFNKIGTSLISLAARERGRPFYVCAETYKFTSDDVFEGRIEERDASEVSDPLSPGDLPGVRFRNPVFDVTPPERISGIVTEKGIVEPSMAKRIAEGLMSGPAHNWI